MGPFTIQTNVVHIWYLFLPDFLEKVEEISLLLSEDEKARAAQFRFNVHRERFAITRGHLRKTLSLYLNVPAETIEFIYGTKAKPYLKDKNSGFFFNVSHSKDMAVFAITKNNEIGIDIEYCETPFKANVAKRFFSDDENRYLTGLSEKERALKFYQIWARKEALIKALGTGFYTPIEIISTDITCQKEQMIVEENQQKKTFEIRAIETPANYEAAVAKLAPISGLEKWYWSSEGNPQRKQ